MKYLPLLTLTALLLAGCSSLHPTASNPPKSFRALFNGTDLAGWYGWNPHTSAKLKDDKLAANLKQQREDFPNHWRVENGELVNAGTGPYATTDAEFGDIELHIEYKTVAKADSGIYLRGTPQVQIWDTLTSATSKTGTSPNQVGSGGLYNNKKAESKPLLRADHLTGEWNRFHIVMVGDKVTVWLNNDLVVRNTPLENYWAPGTPLFETGSIELQAHKTPVWFKNLYLRELPKAAAATK